MSFDYLSTKGDTVYGDTNLRDYYKVTVEDAEGYCTYNRDKETIRIELTKKRSFLTDRKARELLRAEARAYLFEGP